MATTINLGLTLDFDGVGQVARDSLVANFIKADAGETDFEYNIVTLGDVSEQTVDRNFRAIAEYTSGELVLDSHLIGISPLAANAIMGNFEIIKEYLESDPAEEPANLTAPVVSGTAAVGETLTGTDGTWSGEPEPELSAQWQSSENGTSGWSDIADETASTLALTAAHADLYIRRRVTATNSEGSASANSNSVGPVEEEEEPEPGDFARTASTNSTRSIHSGHSLTDAYAYGNGWPGDLVRLRNSLMEPEDWGETILVRDTIPGSSLSHRWYVPAQHATESNPEGPTKSVTDIGSFDALMITEAGPPPRPTSEHMVDTLDYLCRFTANTIENGGGNEVILWSIWPALNGPGTTPENPTPTGDWTGFTFRTGLDEYWRSFKMMADYATWKMHQLYDLPEGWRVWLIPGDRWMARVYDDIQLDLVPGITDIAQLFADDIHPEDRAAYGLSCFAFTSMYQVDLREQTGVYVPDGMATALRDYFWQIAWELATEYEPVGMGGTEGAALWWQPSDGDPMPNWTLADPDTGGGGDPDPDPEPEPGDLPEFALTATADDLTDLTGMTGTQPTVEDGVLKFEGGEALDGVMTLGDRYLVISFMIPGTLPQSSGPAIVGFRAIDTPVWNDHGPISAVYNGFLGRFEITLAGVGSDTSDSASADTWYTLEIWTDTEGMHGVVDGVDSMSVSGEIPETVSVRLFPEGALVCHVAAIGICDHVPTPEERAAARVWAQAAIPE